MRAQSLVRRLPLAAVLLAPLALAACSGDDLTAPRTAPPEAAQPGIEADADSSRYYFNY